MCVFPCIFKKWKVKRKQWKGFRAGEERRVWREDQGTLCFSKTTFFCSFDFGTMGMLYTFMKQNWKLAQDHTTREARGLRTRMQGSLAPRLVLPFLYYKQNQPSNAGWAGRCFRAEYLVLLVQACPFQFYLPSNANSTVALSLPTRVTVTTLSYGCLLS